MVENMRNNNRNITEDISFEIQELKLLTSSYCSMTKNRYSNTINQSLEPPDDFRKFSIYPTKTDLLDMTKMEVFLRKNKIVGAYKSVDDYLDIQFRLMREDFIQPIRDGLIQYMNPSNKKLFAVRFYKNVAIINSLPSHRHGIVHVLKFDSSRFKNFKWENSKRLLHGSFLCLSNDHFETLLFAEIVERDVNLLKNGLLKVKFDTLNFNQNKVYTMLESSILFESYKHVLLKLQETNEENLPMKDYLVYADKEIKLPSYLIQNSQLKYLVNGIIINPGLKDYDWPTADQLSMDQSQLNAFRNALTNELAIIQGPPGTGKTFLGLKICKSLVENVQKLRNFGPILIVCYTNHALDQFLEGILEFSEKIVRIGGRSKSDKIKSYHISNLKNNSLFQDNKSIIDQQIFQVKQQYLSLQAEINLLKQNLVNFQYILDKMTDKKFDSLKDFDVAHWLTGRPIKEKLSKKNIIINKIIEDLFFNEISNNVEYIVYEAYNDKSDDAFNVINDDDTFINDERLLAADENEMYFLNYQYNKTYETLKKTYFDSKCSKTAKNLYEVFLSKNDKMKENEVNRIGSLYDLTLVDRWRLYRYWNSIFISSIKEKIGEIEENYRDLNDQLNEINFEEDRRFMIEQDIIGMTTTGAARYGKVLSQIKCKIIIVEEAAEVLESHIIGSLNDGCEHLILIGDHKQLKPNPAVYELAKRFNLDLSLFERLINNGLSYTTLSIQHRMRPEIAEIMKYIYVNLQNSQSVYEYPDVPGLKTNLFFFNHCQSESLNDELMSYYNTFEASFVFRFCLYLIKNGIEGCKITILTLYSSQMLEIRKNMRDEVFKEVRICVVDNYQGEENDIILLSLVRSNEEEKIGFLNIENRICVSLSRAKHGLFVFGNFNILSNQSVLWKNICRDLTNQNLFGNQLSLFCQNHPEKIHLISEPSDFDQCPEGCCDEICSQRLECGHACRRYCHVLDKYHRNNQCMENCLKSCINGHPCPLKCYEGCSICEVAVVKILPECFHEKSMPCYKEPQHKDCDIVCDRTLICGHISNQRCGNESNKCLIPVTRICDKCGNEKIYACYLKLLCNENCLKILSCGHKCNFKCYVSCGYCEVTINKIIPECNHEQMLPCFKVPEHKDCKITCEITLKCGHTTTGVCKDKRRIELFYECKQACSKSCSNGHPCQRKCYEKCQCEILVSKHIPECNHEQILPCFKFPEREDCKITCDFILKCGHTATRFCGDKRSIYLYELGIHNCKQPCLKSCSNGHPCQRKCYEKCKCKVLVSKLIPDCNHEQMFPCYKDPKLADCQMTCEIVLKCSHTSTIFCRDKKNVDLYELKSNKCKQPCLKSCSNGHPCQRKCYKSCQCEILVSKRIPECNHEEMLPCYKIPDSTDCKTLCEFTLNCGHTTTRLCGDKSRSYICNEECLKSCADGHRCLLKCFEKCRCEVMVLKVIPNCNHEQLLPCYKIPESKDCQRICEFTLPCNHKILKVCSSNKLIKDLEKGMFKCKQNCSKICKNGHLCTLKCHEICKCKVLVLKSIPGCNHQINILCYLDPKPKYCVEKIQFIRPCGHVYMKECGEDSLNKLLELKNCGESCLLSCANGHPCAGKCGQTCVPCQVIMPKYIPECNHTHKMACCMNERPDECKSKCNRFFRCGHYCIGLCNGKCQPCLEDVQKTCNECGNVSIYKCSERKIECLYPCNAVLGCGHECTGTCSSCRQFHKSCENVSDNKLVCDHVVKTKCNAENQPCVNECNEACIHSKCSKRCSEECIDCNEKCGWSCDHYRCTNLCHQFCNRPICDYKCFEIVLCNKCNKRFSCYGVCGEICRQICPRCDPFLRNLKITNFKSQKFITLRTCDHTFDCDVLDKYMNDPNANGEVAYKKCPKCSKIINNSSCFRYSNLIKVISLDIRRIHKFFINGYKSNLLFRFQETIKKNSKVFQLYSHLNVENYFTKLISNSKSCTISNFDVVKFEISLNLVKLLHEYFFNFIINDTEYGVFYYTRDLFVHLLNDLDPFIRTFDNNEIENFKAKFDRMQFLWKLSIIDYFDIPENIRLEFVDELKANSNFSGNFADEFHKKVLRCLKMKRSSNDSQDFKRIFVDVELVNNLHKGQWFKCKKGHYYMKFKKPENMICRRCLKDVKN